jgi:hypothetical protein
MSTRQVERLEALLATVQRNRGAQRGDNGAERVQQAPAVVRRTPAEPPPAPVAAPVSAPPPPPPAPPAPAPAMAQPARARPAPTPLEMALEGRASGGVGKPERAAPAAPPPSPPTEGRVLAEPNTAEPTKPIVQVVSKQPPAAAASFGELLKRSLSLRPR